MNAWTLNHIPEKDLGIDRLTFTVRNQDEGFCEINFAQDYDAPTNGLFAPGQWIVFRFNGSVAFRGKVDGFGSIGAGGVAETRSLRVYDPWHFLAATTYTQSYPYYGGAQTTSHITLGGPINTVLTEILTAAGASICLVGTIDCGTLTVIPTSDHYDISYADAIRHVLNLCPGAQVVFDHSTHPPTCHILRRHSGSLATFALDPQDGKVSNYRSTVLNERKYDGVALAYEAPATVVSKAFSFPFGGRDEATTISEQKSVYIGGATAGSVSAGKRVFRSTIPLVGQRTITNSSYSLDYLNFSYDTLYKTDLRKVWMFYLLPALAARTGHPESRAGHITAPANITGENANWGVTKLTGGIGALSTSAGRSRYCLLMRSGFNSAEHTEWTFDQLLLRSVPAELLYDASTNPSGLKVISVNMHWAATYTTNAMAADFTMLFVDTGVSLSADDAFEIPGTLSGTTTKTEGTVEAAPANLATSIFADLGELTYEGMATVKDANPLTLFGLTRKLTQAGLTGTSMIQQVTYDASTDLADITFGPPSHLGPQDRLSIRRARRALA